MLGAVTEAEVREGVENGLIQTVCSAEMVRMCEKAAAEAGKQTEVHIKADTGMGRIGVRTPEEMQLVLDALQDCSHVHCCNSAAIHRFPEMALDMVRAGISLYGYPPVSADITLKPCMEWKASVSYIKELEPGSFVSYGRTYRNEKPLRAATVTCGYGDGYHRCAGKDGYVILRGKKAKILGRVCMDQMVVDVTGIEEAVPGDEVTLMGTEGQETISAEDIASWAGTISYEILLSCGSRVERIFCQ